MVNKVWYSWSRCELLIVEVSLMYMKLLIVAKFHALKQKHFIISNLYVEHIWFHLIKRIISWHVTSNKENYYFQKTLIQLYKIQTPVRYSSNNLNICLYSARNLEMSIRFSLKLGRLNNFIGQKCLKLKLRSAFVPTWSWFVIKM